jgi:8-amino-7-oxononanoate synthase
VGEAVVYQRGRVSWDRLVARELDDVRAAGRWRAPRDLATTGAVTGTLAGGAPTEVVSFASNDYLGLTHHPEVRAAAAEAVARWGTGSGASRLVVGSRPLHAELEAELADWKGTEDALLFPTGYHANLGVLSTLAGEGVTVLSDELNHASIVDGCRLARAAVRIVRHRDLDQVDAHLATLDGPALVVTDSAFSMDGDAADVEGLLTVCSWYGALLVVDEAHAVLGPDVPGWLGTRAAHDPPLLRMGTLSKALGSLGGYVAGPKAYVDLLRNRARSFIFTTASSPADTAAGLAALRVVRSAEGAGLVARLRYLVDRVAPGHPTPIVPVVVGGEADAVAASAGLLERGLLVPAIRPPTVPPGTSRLRIALSAAHTDAQVTHLLDALADLDLYRPAPVPVGRPLVAVASLRLAEPVGPGGPASAAEGAAAGVDPSPGGRAGEGAAGDEAAAEAAGEPAGGPTTSPRPGDGREVAAPADGRGAVVIGLTASVLASSRAGGGSGNGGKGATDGTTPVAGLAPADGPATRNGDGRGGGPA